MTTNQPAPRPNPRLSPAMKDNLRWAVKVGHTRIKKAQADALVARGLAEWWEGEDKLVRPTEAGRALVASWS